MSDRLDLLDYYTLLGVTETATADQIKVAFRAFARKYHPDRFASASPDKRARAAQIYRRGAEGYRVLTHPEKRRIYDAGLPSGRLRFDPSADGSGSSPGAGTKRRVMPPKARPFASKAKDAIKAKSWSQAKLNLKIALSHAPDDPELTALLAEVERVSQGGAK